MLDEIDVGLDTEHTPTMIDALHGLRERTGCTLLVTAHDLSLARAIADHLAILVNGRIVAHGRPDDVLDGINATDDFNRIYEYSDFTGPPRLDDAKATVGGRQTKTLHLTVDVQMVRLAAIAVILIAVVFLAAKVIPF